MTGIDLTVLDALEDFGASRAGTPLMLDLARVHEDPQQPRRDFEDILELASSIAENGVKVPITVRPHPSIPGDYMVKFGARRRRASLAAGLTQIPGWLEEQPNDFEQVIENVQRSDLTALEMAEFIARKVAAGLKHAEIAKRLGIHRTAVTKFLVLIDPAPEIDAVYKSGRSTSPDTLFDLRAVLTEFPEQTKAWLATDVEVSRRSVADLKRALTEVADERVESAEPARRRRKVTPEDPDDIKRPVVAVKVEGRFGIIVLSRRAIEDDHLLVKWDHTGEVSAVPCRDVRVLSVGDARRYEPLNRGLGGGALVSGANDAEEEAVS